MQEYACVPNFTMTALKKSEINNFFSLNGMDLYLEKPYLKHHLLEVIEEGLHHKFLKP